MAILDKGDQTVTVFPSVEQANGYGTPTRESSSEGIEVSGVFVLQLEAPENATEGQSAPRRYRVLGRDLLELGEGLDAFAELEWNGVRLEVIGTPIFRRFPARLAHVSLIARER